MVHDARGVYDIFFDLIDTHVWNSRRTLGTFLVFEFGTPHLSIREPVPTRGNSSKKSREALSHRKVLAVGRWQLWIQDSNWQIISGDYNFNSENIGRMQSSIPQTDLDYALGLISGQKLAQVKIFASEFACELVFDLGGVVKFDKEPFCPGTQWCLYENDKAVQFFDV